MNSNSGLSIHPLIRERRSPRAFDAKPVTPELMKRLFEAARWAPSSYNNQPWRFIYAHKGSDAYTKLLSTAVEFNRNWAQHAPVLMLSLAKKTFDFKDEVNPHAWHDLGMAMQNLALQATEMGLVIHQMAGFDAQQARQLFAIPDDFDVVALIAIGYPGDKIALPEDLRKMEEVPRTRKPIDEIAFENQWK